MPVDGAYLEKGLLDIPAVSTEVRGEFTCEASNTLGTIRKTVKILLNGDFVGGILTVEIALPQTENIKSNQNKYIVVSRISVDNKPQDNKHHRAAVFSE